MALTYIHLDIPIVYRLLISPSIFLIITVISCAKLSNQENNHKAKKRNIVTTGFPTLIILILVFTPSAYFFSTLLEISEIHNEAISSENSDDLTQEFSNLSNKIANYLRVDSQLKYGLSNEDLKDDERRSVFDFIVLEAELNLVWEGHNPVIYYIVWALSLILICYLILLFLKLIGFTFSISILGIRMWRILYIILALTIINLIANFSDEIRGFTRVNNE